MLLLVLLLQHVSADVAVDIVVAAGSVKTAATKTEIGTSNA